MKKRLKAIGMFLTRPDIFFYALIWLMVLLIVGTVAQKYIGLYQAQNTYFSSLILWWGPLPLPGGLMTIGIIFTNLFAKLVFASPWRWKNSGTIINHLGALLLLLGGLLTVVGSYEGNMVIYEGTSTDFLSDYHERELVVVDGATQEKVASYPWEQLKPGNVFKVPELGFTIEIVKSCRNCNIFPRRTSPDDPLYKELRGRTRDFDMLPIALNKEDEKNKSGVLFRIKGADEKKDGIHMSFDFIPVSPWVMIDGTTYSIALRYKRTYLPFAIKLLDFEKQYHPGTAIPRKFKSDIILMEDGIEWPSVISMNQPLRYKGYTFYQASFIDTGELEATVFAVVKNAGRMFPYIASIIMCIGLFIHLSLNIPRLIKKA